MGKKPAGEILDEIYALIKNSDPEEYEDDIIVDQIVMLLNDYQRLDFINPLA